MPDGIDAPFWSTASPEDALQNIKIEQSLLGALLANSGLIRHLPETFSAEHYADPLHGEVHRAIVELSKPGVPVALPVMQILAADDKERRVYIGSLLSAANSHLPNTIGLYAECITDLHRRRGLHAAAGEMQQAALSSRDVMPAQAAIALAMNKLEGLLADGGCGRPAVSLEQAIDLALDRADQVAAGACLGLSTGFRTIDDTLGLLEPGQMFVLAGRPGTGKSALGMQIAVNVARSGVGVLAISLEMTAVELGRRALSACARVPLSLIKQGRHHGHVRELIEARKELQGLPLTIEDGGGLTAGMIAIKARAARRRLGKSGLGLIVVDHLHIVRPDDADARHGSTWAVGRVSGAMKRLAKEHECPVLVLAQLNRGVEGRDDKRPGLADLRHAGDIEQDADAVAFVYRAEYYLGSEPDHAAHETPEKHAARLSAWHNDKERLRGKAELIFAKVRDGCPGTVPLNFHGETTSFSEPAI